VHWKYIDFIKYYLIMAAIDTFDWLVSTGLKDPDDELRKFVAAQRACLLTLRNEDERQRFVNDLMFEIRNRAVPKKTAGRKTS
jgi:hypothetical protein